ncbi:MAG: methylenetetrahydrofolate reductase [Holophagales bacterium]|nr:methylenetetrahydrofolate reductase [Holophagales bacterium]
MAGDVGPLGQLVKPYGPLTKAMVRELFSEQIRILLEEKVDLLLFETFSSRLEAIEAIKAARDLSKEIPILASMTFLADGKTTFGTEVVEALSALEEAGADVVGMNCTIGPQETLEVFQKVVSRVGVPVAAMPNAGYPWNVSGRTVYPATPDYFREVARLREGRRRDRRRLLRRRPPTSPPWRERSSERSRGRRTRRPGVRLRPGDPGSRVARDLAAEEKARRPESARRHRGDRAAEGTDASAALDGAQLLRSYGVDAVNVTDNPMARLRMSSIAVAHMIRHETGVDTVFHFSPRDRNVLSIQSDLLGAAGLGIKALLVVGGDPLKIGDYPQGRHVGEVDTLGLLRIVRGLNSGVDLAGSPIGTSTSFAIACAANPAAPDLDVEISKLAAKIEAGATFAQTQPVYDVAALDRFFARPEARLIPVLVGLIPPRNLKQALYFANEVPGMVVPEAILNRMRRAAEKGPQFEAEEGLAIGIELAGAIAERARGIHLMPMARYDVVQRVLASLPARGEPSSVAAGTGEGR